DRLDDVGHDRAVRGGAHGQRDVLAPGHLDRLGVHVHGDVVLAAQHPVPAHVLEVEVGDVRVKVGEAPGDRGVVPDDDAGEAGEGEACDVEGALLVDRAAVEAGLGPDAGL